MALKKINQIVLLVYLLGSVTYVSHLSKPIIALNSEIAQKLIFLK